MEIKTYDQIFNDMRNYIITHQDKLTDFNEGSVLLSQVEAFAREMAMLYIRCRVGFSSYIRNLPYSVFGFKQKSGLKASGKVVFSGSKPFSSERLIPSGTIVAAGNLYFLTTETGKILSGDVDSNELSVVAQEPGEKYNVGSGAINNIISILSNDIIKVNNPEPTINGTDGEDWATYNDRFTKYIIGLQRTNEMGLVSALINTDFIKSCYVKEHFPPLDNFWNITIYIENGSGSITPEEMEKAKAIIDGNITQGIHGYRIPGINIRYLPPNIIPIELHIDIVTNKEIALEINESNIVSEVIDEMKKYINKLKIGESLLLSNLIIILRRLNSIINARITNHTEDIFIGSNEIARFEECIITVVEQ